MIHIRKKLRRRGGNQFYRDTSERTAATLCGAPVTDRDVNRTKAGIAWVIAAMDIDGERGCLECLTIAKED